jgi:hypothetical protein
LAVRCNGSAGKEGNGGGSETHFEGIKAMESQGYRFR